MPRLEEEPSGELPKHKQKDKPKKLWNCLFDDQKLGYSGCRTQLKNCKPEGHLFCACGGRLENLTPALVPAMYPPGPTLIYCIVSFSTEFTRNTTIQTTEKAANVKWKTVRWCSPLGHR